MTKEITTTGTSEMPSLTKPETLAAFSVQLKQFIVTQNLYTPIQGKNYVNVEGWQFAGASMGLVPIVDKCERLDRADEIAYQAEVTVWNGERIVSRGMAICSNKENKKRNFDEYAIQSMAQTRAMGKAYRLLLGFLMKMAGYEATPIEEMPQDEKIYEQKKSEGTGTFCSVCGEEGFKKKDGGDCCPNWKKHKEDNVKFSMLENKEQANFAQSLDDIPTIRIDDFSVTEEDYAK